MRNVHVWKTTTTEGEKREVRAERFGGRWKFQSKVPSAAQWSYYDVPPVDELETLRDIVWRKYQRKRLPWDDVASLDQMLKERRSDAGPIQETAGEAPSTDRPSPQ
jgi:hypothetical protein